MAVRFDPHWLDRGATVPLTWEALQATLDEVERLRNALEPFADYGKILEGQLVREDSVLIELWGHRITVADLRKAARVWEAD